MIDNFSNKKLVKIFKERRLATTVVSRECNISSGTLRFILNGDTTNPKVSTLKALAKYLDVNIKDII